MTARRCALCGTFQLLLMENTCPKCKTTLTYTPSEVDDMAAKLKSEINYCCACDDENEVYTKLAAINAQLMQLRTHLHPLHVQLNKVGNLLAECYMSHGQFAQASCIFKSCLKFTEKV
jgi:hypothetical protein